jgi:hypothetical protein
MSRLFIYLMTSIVTFFAIGSFLSNAKATIEAELKGMAGEIQPSLPIAVSKHMSLVEVFAAGRTISYVYVLNYPSAQLAPAGGIVETLRSASKAEKTSALCAPTGGARWVLDAGATWRFVFNSIDGHFVFSYAVTRSDCK